MKKLSRITLLSIDGYKAVTVLSLAAVGIYTAIKLVDKLCGASVVINADNRKVEGKCLTEWHTIVPHFFINKNEQFN